MSNKIMLKQCAFITILCVSFIAGLAVLARPSLALVSYDTLTSSPIDPNKWDQYESLRVIPDGKLLLGIRSSKGSTAPVLTVLPLANSTGVQKFGATLIPDQYVNASGTDAMVAVGGRFYNDGSSTGPGDCTGDVLGQVAIGKVPDRSTWALYWGVVRFTSPDCTSYERLDSGYFSTSTVVTGTAYPVSIEWTGASFNFTYNGDTRSYTPTGTINAPVTPFLGLYALISDNIGKDAFISAYLDDVYVNGEPFDDFSTNRIDANKWGAYEFVRAIDDEEKHLVLMARGTAYSPSLTKSVLPIVKPEGIGTLQATVTPHILTSSDDTKGHAIVGVGGRFFNDGTMGDGLSGDIGAFVRLQTSNKGLIGRWKVTRYTGEDEDSQETIAQGDSKKLITLDKPYNLSVSWDGTKFTFVGNKETFTYTPPVTVTANATTAKGPFKGLYAAVTDPGVDATAQGNFTNVMAGDTPHFLTVNISGTGSVTSSPSGITCTSTGGKCSKEFPYGRRVTLIAKAAKNWVLQNWSGACSKKTCSVTMDEARSATANFICSPTLFITPAGKKFGNVKANSKTSTALFTIINKTTKGSANLLPGDFIFTGNTTDFRIEDNKCSNQTILPNGKCTFKAVFQPLSTGTDKKLVITIPSNDIATPNVNVELTGNGT